MSSHLSQDELLDQMYGVGMERSDEHLRQCGECSNRLSAMQQRRAEASVTADAPGEFLAAQRRAIYDRLERPSSVQARWAPALAAAFLLAMGVMLYRPYLQRPAYLQQPAHAQRQEQMQAPVQVAAAALAGPAEIEAGQAELNDEKLLSDLYSMEQSVEPRAAAPIHELFEGDAGAGGQE